jgi:integral membrane sensor domain MASE1
MVLWWIANLVGLLVVIPLVLHLASNVLREAVAIKRYADEILVHGVGITGNLDPVPALADTARLTGVAKGNAVAYVAALRRLL